MTGGFSDLGTVGAGGGLLLALRNGRAFERDADATGVELLEKLGLRADGVSSFFERMLEEASPTDTAAAARHLVEPSADRRAHRRDAAGRRPARPAFSDAQWAALRNVCK